MPLVEISLGGKNWNGIRNRENTVPKLFQPDPSGNAVKAAIRGTLVSIIAA